MVKVLDSDNIEKTMKVKFRDIKKKFVSDVRYDYWTYWCQVGWFYVEVFKNTSSKVLLAKTSRLLQVQEMW